MRSWLERSVERVEAGKSKTFNDWHKFTGVSKDNYIAALKWLANDPMVVINGKERLSREVGCRRNGELIYGKRYYFRNGEFNGVYPIDKKLTRLDFPYTSINKHSWV